MTVVSLMYFNKIVNQLMTRPGPFGLDSETTGLRMFHGDRIFSLIISDESEDYYFNFNTRENDPTLDLPNILSPTCWEKLKPFLEREDVTWFIQNAANFDMPMLAQHGIELKGDIHCTKAIGRVVYNEHISYSLEKQAERIGEEKSKKVDEYIAEHKLYKKFPIPGKSTDYKEMYFHKVPFHVIAPYGCQDARITRKLGINQQERIKAMDEEWPELVASNRALDNVYKNEKRLQKTIYRMKMRGVKIDRGYCERARDFEEATQKRLSDEFADITGRKYAASPKLFAEVFANERPNWRYTDKGNPSFESDVLASFDSGAARAVLGIREAKSKADFYNGFLWFADSNDVIHPNFNPDQTVHGRFSSSEPNFQNLTNEEDDEPSEWMVRRAIIPREGFKLLSIDWKAMEFRFMLENACRILGYETSLTKKINEGHDVHQATVDVVKEKSGIEIPRRRAKIANFLTVYGGGPKALSENLKISLKEAKELRWMIFDAAPEIREYIEAITKVAEERGFIVNWLGRRSHFPNKRFAYKAPNYHISGGCADVAKIAMNKIDDLLLGLQTKFIMMVHDEFIFEVPLDGSEDYVKDDICKIMETVYPYKYIPLLTDASWSTKSLGDLE